MSEPRAQVPTAPARVLLVLGPSSGGIRRHVAVLRDGLRDLGWEVTTAGPEGVLDGLGGVDHAVPIALSPASVVIAARRLRTLGRRVDLVHAHGLKAGVAAVMAGCRPRVLTVHNVVLDEAAGSLAPVLRAVERRLPAHMDHTLPVSAEIATHLGIAGRRDVTVVVPAGPAPVASAAPGAVRAELGIGDAPLVVTVARLHPQKDLETLLDAAVAVRRAVPGVRFVVAGGGPSAEALGDRRDRLGLEGVVDLLGPRDDVPDLLLAADVVALSSRWEGSPLVVAEAMTLGRPLVATAVGAVPEAVTDGQTGRLVRPGDPAALADAIVNVLGDPEAAAAMGRAARDAAERRFATGVLVARVADRYDVVLSTSPTSRVAP